MSWPEIKNALNSTLGDTENFMPLDKIIKEKKFIQKNLQIAQKGISTTFNSQTTETLLDLSGNGFVNFMTFEKLNDFSKPNFIKLMVNIDNLGEIQIGEKATKTSETFDILNVFPMFFNSSIQIKFIINGSSSGGPNVGKATCLYYTN